jgi:alpha,alpha-trehalase
MVDRISRKIREDWDELTRTIDKKGLAQILQDEKTTSEVPTLYISPRMLGITYFQDLEKSLKILKLKFCPRIYRGIRSYFKYKAWTSSIRFSSKVK